jgi:hypothetical protein
MTAVKPVNNDSPVGDSSKAGPRWMLRVSNRIKSVNSGAWTAKNKMIQKRISSALT